MRILFLSAWFPYPANNGSKLRIFNMLRGLSTQHEVVLLSFTDNPEMSVDVPALQEICTEVLTVCKKPFTPNSRHALAGFFYPFPRSVYDKFSPEMAQLIEKTVRGGDIDLVIASQVDMAGYYEYFSGVPAIFEEIEVGVLYEQYALADLPQKRMRYWLTWQKHRAYLVELMRHFRAATVVSDKERELLLAHVLDDSHLLHVIPNGVSVADYAGVETAVTPNMLIFTGSFSFGPNYEAMVWFLRDVFPLVLAEVPDAQLIITGKHGNRPLPSMQNVTLAGFVDDIRPYVKSAAVSIAPIWTGGGTRLKILEAMALQTPVVATSKGAEGLSLTDGEQILLADAPAHFSAAVVQLLQSKTLRRQVAERAFAHLQATYDWPIITPRFMQLIDMMVENKSSDEKELSLRSKDYA